MRGEGREWAYREVTLWFILPPRMEEKCHDKGVWESDLGPIPTRGYKRFSMGSCVCVS